MSYNTWPLQLNRLIALLSRVWKCSKSPRGSGIDTLTPLPSVEFNIPVFCLKRLHTDWNARTVICVVTYLTERSCIVAILPDASMQIPLQLASAKINEIYIQLIISITINYVLFDSLHYPRNLLNLLERFLHSEVNQIIHITS